MALEVCLKSVFGSKMKITVPKNVELFDPPQDCVVLMLDGQGFVVERKELEKLKQFLSQI